MEATLLAHTPCAEELIFAAMKQCYSEKDAKDIFASAIAGSVETRKLIRTVIESGHESPVEHVSFTFAISGVSRALTHQLVRHRIASYSQQSQRYVNAEGFEYTIPASINDDPELLERFHAAMSSIHHAYCFFMAADVPAEDARYVLPNAAATKIVVTMNCRSLLHFFGERCCTRAQWEIRDMANRMLAICQKSLPVVFENAGAKCEQHGLCSEGAKFTCGKYPLLKEAK